ncbi:hypothetical protein [Aureimonas sp. AU4]|uniref:hypothetical protein n=1 Tax=Aureimonas sp. AU4 TaxID=1638163 RepID=UPI000780CB87|nr:hypothetical protein [Aureimonas sp. AU4]
MDYQTRIELSMMVLDLRLAARAPSEHVGMRLGPQRLKDIATVLEQVLDDAGTSGSTLRVQPANDMDVPARIVAGLSWRR